MQENMRYPSITVLGSTGSVGEQAIDVAIREGITVNALCANKNAARVEEQARALAVKACAMADDAAAKELKTRLSDTDIRVYAGVDGIEEMLLTEYDREEVVLNSIIGEAGLRPTLATLQAKNLERAQLGMEYLFKAVSIGDEKPEAKNIILKCIF